MKQREIFIISIVIFLTILSWLLIDIAHIKTLKNDEKINYQIPKRLNLNIDSKLFEILESKK